MSYKRLDISQLSFNDEPIPLDKALEDIEPFEWDQDVIDGKSKVIISRQTEDSKKCVK